jgi:hypothetical protein
MLKMKRTQMTKRKKPTVKEVANVLSQVIEMVEYLRNEVSRLGYITETYHEYKKEKEDFIKYLQEKIARDDKDRADNSVLDVKSEEVSEPK